MTWKSIKSVEDLDSLIENSFRGNIGVAIFKHSTRCSISSVAKTRLSTLWDFNETLPIYYLDLITFRAISNLISDKFHVEHESPQLLVIKDGDCVYDASHLSISVKGLRAALEIKN